MAEIQDVIQPDNTGSPIKLSAHTPTGVNPRKRQHPGSDDKAPNKKAKTNDQLLQPMRGMFDSVKSEMFPINKLFAQMIDNLESSLEKCLSERFASL